MFFLSSLIILLCIVYGQQPPQTLMARQTIPLHEISSSVGTETMGDFECYLILDPSEEAVIIYMIAPENMWMGVSFGTTQMDGALAYVYNLNEQTNKYEIWEFNLGNHVIESPKKQIKSYQVQTIDGYTTVMLKRPFNGNPGEYDFTIYDDNLKYIMAAGTSPVLSYHDMGFRANWIGLTVMPPPTAEPTYNPTIYPTYEPTLYPTNTPTYMPSITPTLTPTMKPTTNPTNKPTTNPTNKPTTNPTTKPSSSPVESRQFGIFDRDFDVDVDIDTNNLPEININDITNNNCALDVVFVVDTSVYYKNECIVQGNFIENLIYGIVDKNSDRKAARFSIITYNGCTTTVEFKMGDDWLNQLNSIDFCKNDNIVSDKECDQCLDGFSLGMEQFSRASPNKQVIMLLTNSECGPGLCDEWGLRNLRKKEVWIYSVGNRDKPVLINDLECVGDYINSFENPWDAYTTGKSEEKFLNNACVNVRRENIDRNNIDLNVENIFDDDNNRFIRGIGIQDRFGTDEERFGKDEDRFGRDEDKFDNDFFNNNDNNNGPNTAFFNGNRPNQGFFSRLENGGFIKPQIGAFTPPETNIATTLGRGTALSGNVNDKNGNYMKGGNKDNIYQNELRNIAAENQDIILMKRDNAIDYLGKPKTDMNNTVDSYKLPPNTNKGPPPELLNSNAELQNELRERAAFMQDYILDKQGNIILPKGLPPDFGPKGMNNNNITDDEDDYTPKGYNRPNIKGFKGMGMSNNITDDEDDYTPKGFYRLDMYMDNDNNGDDEDDDNEMPDGYNKPYPEYYTRDIKANNYNRPYPENYLRDTSELMNRLPKGYKGSDRPYPKEYLKDIDLENLPGLKGGNTDMEITSSTTDIPNPEPKGKNFNDIYPEQKNREFYYGKRSDN